MNDKTVIKRSSDGKMAGREEKEKEKGKGGEEGRGGERGGEGWKEVWEGGLTKIQSFKKSKNGVTFYQKDGFVVTFLFSSEEKAKSLCDFLEPRVFPDHCVKVYYYCHFCCY